MHKRNASSRFAMPLTLAATFGAVMFVNPPKWSAPPEAPSSVIGRATVIDGKTLDIGGRRIELFGIDAPDPAQTCRDQRGRSYPCGRQAAYALAVRTAQRTVACEPREMDGAGDITAICRADGEDVNQWLVRRGWAVVAPVVRRDYLRAEAEAKTERLGIWIGPFVPPAEWRRTHPRP